MGKRKLEVGLAGPAKFTAYTLNQRHGLVHVRRRTNKEGEIYIVRTIIETPRTTFEAHSNK